MFIHSKFPAKCHTCGERIKRGERIFWSPGEGGHHLACRPDVSAQAADKTGNAEIKPEKPDLLDWVIVLIPLGLGPALVLMDTKTAFIDFFVLPCAAALLFGGLKPAGGLRRVKWAYRKRTKFDNYLDMITAMAMISLIPGAILWVLIKFI